MKKYIFLFTISFFIFSCGPNYILDEKIEIENQQWTYSDSIAFSVDISDTLQLYNWYLDVDHSTEYSFQNMYIRLHSIFPNGKRTTERISVNFMSRIGQWQGDCNSDECTFRHSLKESSNFDQTGEHRFVIEQFMRKNPLEGIQSIALRIEDTGKSSREK